MFSLSRTSRSTAILALALATLPLTVVAKKKNNRICTPQLGPKLDLCNSLGYISSNVLTGIAFGLFLAVGLYQAFASFKYGAKWMASMTIGIFTFSAGIASRFGLHSQPDSTSIYIAEYLLVVLSPCAFIAADYVLLGRMATHLGAANHLMVKPRRLTPTFVSSDITTFLIQAIGGSISIAANDLKTNRLGSRVFLVGLILQLISFFLFTLMYLRFLQRVRSHNPEAWLRDANLGKPWYRDWRTLAFTLFVSCVGILIRSVYRCIELSQGYRGALSMNEGVFYGLDTLPLFIAVSVYVPFWPGRFIDPPPTAPKDTETADTASDPEKAATVPVS